MIDIGSEMCPNIDVMLGTLTRELTEHEHDLVHNNFNELLQIQIRVGHISDDEYDRIGFLNDVNYGKQIVNTYSNCDSRKRACLLNHEHANRERKLQVLELRKEQYEHELKRSNASVKLI